MRASAANPASVDALGLKCEARIHLVLEVPILQIGVSVISVPGVPVERVIKKIELILVFDNDVLRSKYEAGAHLVQEVLDHSARSMKLQQSFQSHP